MKSLAHRLALRVIVTWLRFRRWIGRRERPPGLPAAAPSVAVVGFLDTASGLGAAARGLCESIAGLDPIPVSLSALSPTPLLPAGPVGEAGFDAGRFSDCDVAVHVYNPDVFLAAVRRYGLRFLPQRCRNIALVNWETDTLPQFWPEVLALYDGLWAPSTFTARAVERATRRPVHVVPNCVPEKPPRVRGREEAAFEFLCMFDLYSDFDRKNPLAVVRAFRAAVGSMPAGVACRLRIKCHSRTPEAIIDRLHRECPAPGVEIVRETFDAPQMDRLWQACDCFVSLHRSEGFGLPVAEALSRGIPVIVTRQGGVLDFVDDDYCFMVPGQAAERHGVGGDYPEWSGWIEPDVAVAARQMLRVVEDYPAAVQRARRGRDRLARVASAQAVRSAFDRAIGATRRDLLDTGNPATRVTIASRQRRRAGLPRSPDAGVGSG